LMIENRLIEEMAKLRGGRKRLEKIREEALDEIDRLKEMHVLISVILERPEEEAVDSP